MNCKHPTLYVLGPENKPAPYGYCMLCEVARLTADIATLERRERSRNNRIAELEDALPALDARKEVDDRLEVTEDGSIHRGTRSVLFAPLSVDAASPASRDGRQGEAALVDALRKIQAVLLTIVRRSTRPPVHTIRQLADVATDALAPYAPAATAEQGGDK